MPFPLHSISHSQPSTLKPRNHEEQNPNTQKPWNPTTKNKPKLRRQKKQTREATLRLSLITFYLETQKSQRTKPKHPETLKPKLKPTTFYLKTHKSRSTKLKPRKTKPKHPETLKPNHKEQNSNHEDRKNKPERWRQRRRWWWLNLGGEGSKRWRRGLLMLSPWIFRWVSWFLYLILSESLRKRFLMFVGFVEGTHVLLLDISLLKLPTDMRKWETERVWLRNRVCKARFQFKWNQVQLTRF